MLGLQPIQLYSGTPLLWYLGYSKVSLIVVAIILHAHLSFTYLLSALLSSAPPQPKTVGGAHASRKGKSETVENQLLRAFARVMASRYRVSTGKEALDLILRSIRVKQVRKGRG